MNCNLDPEMAQVVLDQLPLQPHVLLKPEQTPAWVEAKRRLTAAAESSAMSLYDHLIAQGKRPEEARAHVRHRFGVGAGGSL